MRYATFRWGLGMGLVAAALGVFALLVGAFFFPIPIASTADSVAVAILVRGMLALLALGVTLGLAYYAGLQVERDRIRRLPEASAPAVLSATAQDPGFAAAWYNLAHAQEENEKLAKAIASLQTTLRLSPEYADAHFNLAICLEKVGRQSDADQHWSAYQELVKSGER